MESITVDTTTTQITAGLITAAAGGKQSMIATSLFSANFDQLITFSFQLQFGDLIGLMGLAFALDAYLTRRKAKRNQVNPIAG